MIKPVSAEFADQLKKSVLTLRRLWRLTPMGRDTLFYTDHDRDLEYDGETYVSEKTFVASAISNQLGTGQANFEITTLLTADITKADVEAGIYSGGRVEVDAIFYDHIDFGVMPMFTGAITGVSVPYKFQAIFSCNGFAGTGQHNLTEMYSPTCRAEFCDSRCSLDIADFSDAGVVTAVAGIHTFNASGIGADLNQYALGYVTWVTGANAGRRNEVQSSGGTQVRLLIKPAFQIEVGDTFSIAQGCDKTIVTCEERYNNKINFRASPTCPAATTSRHRRRRSCRPARRRRRPHCPRGRTLASNYERPHGKRGGSRRACLWTLERTYTPAEAQAMLARLVANPIPVTNATMTLDSYFSPTMGYQRVNFVPGKPGYHVEDPRVEDQQAKPEKPEVRFASASTYGRVIPISLGRRRLEGNLIQSSNLVPRLVGTTTMTIEYEVPIYEDPPVDEDLGFVLDDSGGTDPTGTGETCGQPDSCDTAHSHIARPGRA
jgi:uncharacterized phage protein (TIGR02218 family)